MKHDETPDGPEFFWFLPTHGDRFILCGYPHLEEAHRFAGLVMPRMPAASRPARLGARANTRPFGGAISPATARS